MKNVVVKVKSEEHGKRVIQSFKDLGVNTSGYMGQISYYYGLFDGVFKFNTSPRNSQVITLEELQDMANPYPNEMIVWGNCDERNYKHLVVAKVKHEGLVRYVSFSKNTFYLWKHAKPIEDDLTHEERIKILEDEIKKLKG